MKRADWALRATCRSSLPCARSTLTLWLVIRDGEGHQLSEGTVPAEFALIASRPRSLSEAAAQMERGGSHGARRVSPAGGSTPRRDGIQIADRHVRPAFDVAGCAGEHLAKVPQHDTGPIIVADDAGERFGHGPCSWCAGLGHCLAVVAAQAERIDIDQRGVRLLLDKVPIEITLFVKAIIAAPDRLRQGLRTPPPLPRRCCARAAQYRSRFFHHWSPHSNPDRRRPYLLEDATRLSVMAGQLSDLQRPGSAGRHVRRHRPRRESRGAQKWCWISHRSPSRPATTGRSKARG